MSQQNKMIAQRLLDALWNESNYDAVDALLDRNYDGHASTVINGPYGAKQFVLVLRAAFPDFKFIIKDQISEEDRIATRWLIQGTHEGEFQGIAATGKSMTMTGITIFRIVNGKITDGWTNEDVLGLMQQLGAISTFDQSN